MKQAIIVGASSGLGWELAIQLADKGYQLGLMARREDLLEDLAAQLPGTHFTPIHRCHSCRAGSAAIKRFN